MNWKYDMINLPLIHETELGIMREIIRIVETHNLRYYMLGGTLLGAVRHKGFIPWDDDMDIGMPRPDYERFLEIAAKELNQPFKLHTIDSKDSEYAYYYARVEDPRLKLKREISAKSVIIPAWVDVFPLDGVPSDKKEFDKWYKKCNHLLMTFSRSQFDYFSSTKSSKAKSLVKVRIFAKRIIYATKIYKLISPKRSWAKLDRNLKKYDYNNSDTIINFCGYWKIKEKFPKSVYGNGKLYKFEDLMLYGPEDYDYVLTQMYGDYMTPPPDAEKMHHGLSMAGD